MKVTKGGTVFEPVTITIESQKELNDLTKIVGFTSHGLDLSHALFEKLVEVGGVY